MMWPQRKPHPDQLLLATENLARRPGPMSGMWGQYHRHGGGQKSGDDQRVLMEHNGISSGSPKFFRVPSSFPISRTLWSPTISRNSGRWCWLAVRRMVADFTRESARSIVLNKKGPSGAFFIDGAFA